MNLYERIQRAIDYVEENLEEPIDIAQMARQAFMSRAGLYRLFSAFTGYNVKAYIRARRISRACEEILKGKPLSEVSGRFGYATQEAFTRSFRMAVGTTPGRYAQAADQYVFGRVNLVETNFEVQKGKLAGEYPEINVLSMLPRMRAASYRHFSGSPEDEGGPIAMDWAARHGLLGPDTGCRIFGFDYPAYFARARGYEWLITVPGTFPFDPDDIVTEARMPEGMYALITIEYPKGDMNAFIGQLFGAKGRFAKWCRASEYGFGFHQYLEEIVTEDEQNPTARMNLYFPLSRNAATKAPRETGLPAFTGAVFSYDAQSTDGYDQAWALYCKWIEQSGDAGRHKIITAQDSHNKSWGVPGEIWVTNPPEGADLSGLDIRTFGGGDYLLFNTLYTCMDSELSENCYDIYREHPRHKLDGKLLIEFRGLTDDWGSRSLLRLYYPLR